MFGPGTIFQGFAAKLPFHVIHFFKAKHEMVLVKSQTSLERPGAGALQTLSWSELGIFLTQFVFFFYVHK